MDRFELPLHIDGQQLVVSYLRRPGGKTPVLGLHGFGSSKEDYADLIYRPEFDDRDLIFYDAPGYGESRLSDPTKLSIPFLVKVAEAVSDALELSRYHLLGHSMGGLTGLFLAMANPIRCASFFNIEGNVAPEDCFLSRQIVEHPAETPEQFLDGFIHRVRQRHEYSSWLYSTGLRTKVQPPSAPPVFRSMVDLSDNTDLMRIFLNLDRPTAFVHGAQNSHLTYLPKLRASSVSVYEIPHSGHFPMYANAPALWTALADFLNRNEA